MSLALEKGSQMQAPLGQAVIGGLVMSTFATLLVVPSIFAIVIGKLKPASPSIYPDDPESKHYDPNVFVNLPPSELEHGEREHGTHGHHKAGKMPVEDATAFLRRILDEAREKRHDIVTHYTIDDLRVALGFAKVEGDGPRAPEAIVPVARPENAARQ